MLLEGRILPTLLRLAWPNILVMLAQASTGLIETWWVSRLGTDALAGMALVFPVFMMMQMLSGGAVGGGIASAIARALGGGRREDADALVLHAVVINLALGLLFSALVIGFGPPLYRALGGEGASLEAALRYSNVVFAGIALVWLMNAFASVIRGTGNMFLPALAICLGVALLVPLSPLLIFGLGPLPGFGIAGGGHRRGVDDGADRRGARRVSLGGPRRGAAAVGAAALAVLRGHPAGRRGRVAQHAADHPHDRADDRAGRRRGGPGRDRRLRHRRRGWSTCWCRWSSGWARRSSRWSAPTSAPATAGGRCASRWWAARSPSS